MSADDGLKLKNAVITATCHCAPPDNKPTRQEIENCQPFVESTLKIHPWKVALALGTIGWNALFREFKRIGLHEGKIPKFGHGEVFLLADGRMVIGSYHPSQQNTFTKRLTEPMFDGVFKKINKFLN